MKMATLLLSALLLLYLGILTWLYLAQRQLLFHPTKKTPPREGFALSTSFGTVHVERRNPGKARALIYFPGNSERWWEDPDDLARMLPEHTIYFPHYPGYGASQGSPSQESLFETAEALYDRIAPDHQSVDLIGRSLGSGVALYLASRRPIRRLVLLTPFDSITELGAKRYPIFPVRSIIRDPFESTRYAPEVSAPTLILLAQKDRVVPHAHSLRLIESFRRTRPEHHTLPDTDHGDIIDSPEYPGLVREFLESE